MFECQPEIGFLKAVKKLVYVSSHFIRDFQMLRLGKECKCFEFILIDIPEMLADCCVKALKWQRSGVLNKIQPTECHCN